MEEMEEKESKESVDIELRSEDFEEILGSVPPWILRWGIAVLSVFAVLLVAGSAVFRYPDTIGAQVTLTGAVPPAWVVARTSGKLRELFVSDNRRVLKGEYLAVIDNPARTEDILVLKRFLESFDIDFLTDTVSVPSRSLRLGSLQSQYSLFCSVLSDYRSYHGRSYYPDRISMLVKRLGQYRQQYASLLRRREIGRQQFMLERKSYGRDSLLHSRGGLSGKELDMSLSRYLQSQLSEEDMDASLISMGMQISQTEETLMEARQQEWEKVSGMKSQLRSLTSQLREEVGAWELSCVLVSPVEGTVSFTGYWIENQNVGAGDNVFTVIPGGSSSGEEIVGKALLPVARSGKVRAGQKVNVRLDNFPDSEYGMLRGLVRNVSLAPSQAGQSVAYTVEISFPEGLTTGYKKTLPSLPDLRGQAEIITDDVSLLQRFIAPVRKIWNLNR